MLHRICDFCQSKKSQLMSYDASSLIMIKLTWSKTSWCLEIAGPRNRDFITLRSTIWSPMATPMRCLAWGRTKLWYKYRWSTIHFHCSGSSFSASSSRPHTTLSDLKYIENSFNFSNKQILFSKSMWSFILKIRTRCPQCVRLDNACVNNTLSNRKKEITLTLSGVEKTPYGRLWKEKSDVWSTLMKDIFSLSVLFYSTSLSYWVTEQQQKALPDV